MDQLALTKTDLARITRQEVRKFAGTVAEGRLYDMLDDTNLRYGLVYVPQEEAQRPAWVMLLARIVNRYIVIEEDTAVDQTLLDALMTNGGIPREQIVLAYKGETIPD